MGHPRKNQMKHHSATQLPMQVGVHLQQHHTGSGPALRPEGSRKLNWFDFSATKINGLVKG